MEQFEYHQIKDRRPRPKNESVLRSLQNRTSPFLCWINVSLTAWMQIGWTARGSSLEERPISWASVGRKTFLFVCLPGVTLKHCFLAFLLIIFSSYGKHASTISFYLYSSSQVERWSTLIDVAVVLLSYSPNSLFRFWNPGLASRSPNAFVSG